MTTAVVVIVLDLSKPSEVLDTLVFWLEKIRTKLRVRSPSLPPLYPPLPGRPFTAMSSVLRLACPILLP